jgi:three-Cys-motif partner protein
MQIADMDAGKAEHLRQIVGNRADVHIYQGDCNHLLVKDVFPRVQYDDYRRGLCLLDPYGLHLNWDIIQTACQMRTIDIFLNFPVLDMNRNVLWRDASEVFRNKLAGLPPIGATRVGKPQRIRARAICSITQKSIELKMLDEEGLSKPTRQAKLATLFRNELDPS